MIKPVNGRDVGIAIQKDVDGTPTWVVIGCVTGSTFDVDTETDEATCTASGQFKEFIGGQTSFTLGGTLNVRYATADDIDTNIIATDLLDIQLSDDNLIQVRYQIGTATGTVRYTAQAIITKSSFKGQQKGVATYDFSCQGTGGLTRSLTT